MRGLAILTLFCASYSAHGRDIFADPSNLEVLPKSITPAELRETMKMFAMATGSRCNDCHVGEPDQPLFEYDFASDEKERKAIARLMLEMVATINGEHLSKLEADPVSVTCMTCHRGVSRPIMTADAIGIVYAEHGTAAALAHYEKLREQYHGSHSYDFSESVLTDFAQTIAPTDVEGAETALQHNLKHFPDSYQTWFLIGQVRMATNNITGAQEAWNQALELTDDPGARQFIEGRMKAVPVE